MILRFLLTFWPSPEKNVSLLLAQKRFFTCLWDIGCFFSIALSFSLFGCCCWGWFLLIFVNTLVFVLWIGAKDRPILQIKSILWSHIACFCSKNTTTKTSPKWDYTWGEMTKNTRKIWSTMNADLVGKTLKMLNQLKAKI